MPMEAMAADGISSVCKDDSGLGCAEAILGMNVDDRGSIAVYCILVE